MAENVLNISVEYLDCMENFKRMCSRDIIVLTEHPQGKKPIRP